MTREEQIIKEVEMYTGDVSNLAEWSDGWEDYNDYKYVKKAFINGAKWADKTMVEKACEWLKENIDIYAKVVINTKSNYPEIVMCDTFEKNFKKAMEE